MASYANFSFKDRKYRDSDTFNRPDLFETNNVNDLMLQGFQKHKDKWRELCSYFRFYPDIFLDYLSGDNPRIELYFYQRVYLRIMMRYRKVFLTATRGTSKCVTGDTLLFTNNGIKEIGELSNYSKDENELDCNVKLLDGFNELNNATTIFVNGKRDTKKITTSDGYVLTGTLNHPVLIMQENGEYDFKNLEDIKIGDYIAISRGHEIFGNEINLNIDMDKFLRNRSKELNKSLIHCKIPNKLDEDLGYYLGLLIGDGCLTRDNIVSLSSADKEIADFFININKNVFSLETRYDNKYGYIINSIYFRELLKQIGMDKVDSHNKSIPKCILKAPKNIIASFLSGLFDTDGTVDKRRVSYCTSSEKLSKQVQIILSNFGIICNRIKRYNKKFNTYHYIINIYNNNIDLFKDKIGFKLSRKQNILNSAYNCKRNPNKDIIPYQGDKINRLTSNNKYQNNQLLKRTFEHVRNKNNDLTYYRLNKLHKFNINIDLDYLSLMDLNNLNYYWDKVTNIKDSNDYVYDICVDNSHTFVGNAIVNHNSFLQNLAFVLKCIMYPRIRLFCCAPGKEQAAKITADCLNDIFEFWPLLRNEVKRFIENKDYTKLIFYNGSRYDVVQMRDSTRGGRRSAGAIEEIVDKKFDGDMLNSVVIPLMANDRMAVCNKIDPNEIHKSEVYLTTAGTQQQFGYQKLREVYQDMINGKSAFCIGNSYELPCLHGQLDIDFIEELRESPTYSIMDFMREYQSIWTGSSSDSLVSDEKLRKTRVVGIAEWEHCGDDKVDYCLAYDVSRNEGDVNALSCLTVIKMTPKSNGDYVKEIVNIFSMEGQHSTKQAKFLKQKVKEFRARILVIDNNGLGVAVTDSLILDLNDGNPPYSVINDSEYDKYKLDNSIPIVFALKSQKKETRNSDMINHFMQVFNKLDIGLLKSTHEGIKDLEKKLKRKIKDSEELANAEIPYILTDNLCEEIMNLTYKQAGNETRIERISKAIQKDKFSSLLYGLYWIYLEEKKNKIAKKKKINWLDFCLY